MNGLINVIQIIMNSNNVHVQLIEDLFKQYQKKNILVALQNKTNTNQSPALINCRYTRK